MLGHIIKNCPQIIQCKQTEQTTTTEVEHKVKHSNDGWKIVNFRRRNNEQNKDKTKGVVNKQQ